MTGSGRICASSLVSRSADATAPPSLSDEFCGEKGFELCGAQLTGLQPMDGRAVRGGVGTAML